MDNPTDSDVEFSRFMVKSEQSEAWRNNLVLQIARALAGFMAPEREKHQLLSDQHDALIQKCNALARYARHTLECDKSQQGALNDLACTCGLNDLLAGITVKP